MTRNDAIQPTDTIQHEHPQSTCQRCGMVVRFYGGKWHHRGVQHRDPHEPHVPYATEAISLWNAAHPKPCMARHPSHPKQVRCQLPKGHDGDHFHDFYMRSWSVGEPEPSGACLAEYPWPGRTLRCQRPAGHDGQHEDGDDDTGEQWAWGGPHNDAHLTFPDGDATWTPAGSPQDAPGRLEGTRAVSQYPGAPVACCDWALVAYRDVGLVATPDTSARTCQRHPHLDPDDYRMAQAYLLTQGRCQVCDSLMGNHHATDCRMGTGIVAPDLTGWAPGEVTEAYGK